MHTLKVFFRNSDDRDAPFKGKFVEWFVTVGASDPQSAAVLQGSGNTTVNTGFITITINDTDAERFGKTDDTIPRPLIYLNYTIGAVTKTGIPISLFAAELRNNQSISAAAVDAVVVREVTYDLPVNNKTDWDWLIWETEGNADPKYRRGGKSRKLGLYRLNYDKLRKAGQNEWQHPYDDHTIGGGWVKVAVLDSYDYTDHKELIQTFLPCFKIEDGKVKEPDEFHSGPLVVSAARSPVGSSSPNTMDTPPPVIIMPFNYNDNGGASNAIGKDLTTDLFPNVKTKRLELELTRWATASRSTITAFPKQPPKFWKSAGTDKTRWPLLRPAPTEGLLVDPYYHDSWKSHILGLPDGKSLGAFQKDNDGIRYYSVKTGVEFVSTVNQSKNKKDLLEENSIHAMNRSNLIWATIKRMGGIEKFEARYQIEVLCILLQKNAPKAPDNTPKDEVRNQKAIKAVEIKVDQTALNTLSEKVEKLSKIREALKTRWDSVTEKIKLKEEEINKLPKDEDKPPARLELETKTKEDWLKLRASVADQFNSVKSDYAELRDRDISTLNDYDSFIRLLDIPLTPLRARKKESEADLAAKKGIDGFDGIQVREVAKAGIGEVWFPALAIPAHGKAFVEHWAVGQDWLEFWKKNFAVPMGRAKGEMLLHFGMQHMTSNSQNFLVAFDRKPGGKDGKLKHIILRDIGDTLYNDYVFDVLKGVDDLFKKEFEHESADEEFGVTLQSGLGSYTMPRMLRIGASIVFLFIPFVQGDIAALSECYRILADWSVAHNRAFVTYMQEKIGYTKDWNPGADTVPPEILKAISENSELKKENEEPYRDLVVPGVIGLNSTSRWRLINEFEEKCRNIPLTSDTEAANIAMKLVNAHEVLICAEIQGYLRSDSGKAALKKLHLGDWIIPPKASPVVSASPSTPVINLEKFNQLTTGMNYAEVVKIIGSAGIDKSTESQSKLNIKTYQWVDGNKTILVLLDKDKLATKNQANLS